MAYTPKPEDMIDAPELSGEHIEPSVETAPTEAEMHHFGEQIKQTVAEVAVIEKTPAEVAQISELEQVLKNPTPGDVEVPTPVEGAPDEVGEGDSETEKAKKELEEYLGVEKLDLDTSRQSFMERVGTKLELKAWEHREEENKSFKKFGWTSAGVGATSGIAALGSAAGIGGAGVAGGLGFAAVGGLFAAPAILAMGGGYWGGKKLWNKYKEYKARKNADKISF